MGEYVRLLARREGGKEFSRRQSFGEHVPGSREIAEAQSKAYNASVTWLRIEPHTEFKIEVSPTPWR